MKNLVLVGFMGSGKTSAGKLVAQRLGLKFVDMDDLMEQRHNQTISNIFETKGDLSASEGDALGQDGGGLIAIELEIALWKTGGGFAGNGGAGGGTLEDNQADGSLGIPRGN